MKKLFLALSLLGVIVFASACSSVDEPVYSCNSDVNAWVKANLSTIQQMDRNQWLQLGENVKRASFIAFTAKQKQLFWEQKIEEILVFDWNANEKEHLERLLSMIKEHPQWFEDAYLRVESNRKEFEILTFKWADYARNQLGWSKDLVGNIIASGNRLIDKTGKMEVNGNLVTPKTYSESSCNCSKESDWCSSDWKCKNSKCEIKINACGTFWRHDCDGDCAPW
ncbi:MAG: bacteriocin fulvocin C-related protein [Prevotellaceae bacterium]|jgi:hypothetical protein|nr:bacteriocin fulvocin C-related protein [Prevotellaceae bacterium]